MLGFFSITKHNTKRGSYFGANGFSNALLAFVYKTAGEVISKTDKMSKASHTLWKKAIINNIVTFTPIQASATNFRCQFSGPLLHSSFLRSTKVVEGVTPVKKFLNLWKILQKSDKNLQSFKIFHLFQKQL